MSAYQNASQIQLAPMSQLAEAVDSEDDWTGLTDAASRRKRQNRLNVRAYRRRKALESQAHLGSTPTSGTITVKPEPGIPCWVEDQQRVLILPASVARRHNRIGSPLIPYETGAPEWSDFDQPSTLRIIFPLAPDHLITLLQYNVLRASIINRRLISGLRVEAVDECTTAALYILPDLSSCPQEIPPSLHPTLLQRTIPHEGWVDIIPHPTWRDNVLLAIGTFDDDDLWSDVMGGLFEGFPHTEIEQRGIIAWSPPWDVSGWEISEGFWRKWGWTLKGCEDVLVATNRWRMKRGEEPIVIEL